MGKTEERLRCIEYRLKELGEMMGVDDRAGLVGEMRRLHCDVCGHKTLHLTENLMDATGDGPYIKEHRKRCVTCGTLWKYEDKVVVEEVKEENKG